MFPPDPSQMGQAAPMPPMPPEMAAADPMSAPPGAPMGAEPLTMFPSLDPDSLMQIISQVKGVQQEDLMAFAEQQDTVLAAVLEALGIGSANPSLGVAGGAAFGAPESGMAPPMSPPADPMMGAEEAPVGF